MDEKKLALFSIVSVIVLFGFYQFFVGEKVFSGLFKRYVHSDFSNVSIEFAGEKTTGILFTWVIPCIIFITILDIEPNLIGLTHGSFYRNLLGIP